MSAWVLWPRDPVVVRDGRPNQGRSESATLAFPWPGTAAGVLRTRVGSDANGRFVGGANLDALRAIMVRGPLLTDGATLYVPAPRDALAIRGEKDKVFALHPLKAAEALCDGAAPATLVGAEPGELPDGKPDTLPAWWRWADFATWLTERGTLTRKVLTAGGIKALPRERRVHVKIGADGVAEDAMLFETDGLRFTRDDKAHPIAGGTELGLYLDASGEAVPRAGLGAFAGERRLVRWEASTVALPAMPDALKEHLAATAATVRVRVVLLTPGSFAAGSQPSNAAGAPFGSRDGVTAKMVASIVQRPETISGWDFAAGKPNAQKPTRRLVSAGSVFWIDLTGPAAARLAWAEAVWMHNVSDGEQDRRDGYGLAALGVG